MERSLLKRANQTFKYQASSFLPSKQFGRAGLTGCLCPPSSCSYTHLSASSVRAGSELSRHGPRWMMYSSTKSRNSRHLYSSQTSSGQSFAKPKTKSIRDLSDAVLHNPSIPAEEDVTLVLSKIEGIAQQLIDAKIKTPSGSPKSESETPASVLLSLDSRSSLTSGQLSTEEIDYLSDLAYRIVTYPSVFITPEVLTTYTSIQCLLSRPSSLPEIFDLYATKPVPSIKRKSDPTDITYSATSPNAIATAVPTSAADQALDAAIRAHDLALALSIINTSYRTTSYRRARIFKRALPGIVGAGLAPVATYVLASQLSTLQNGVPPENFTTMAFAGMATYMACVGTIGYVAVTTSNDQMERVTWAIGMPLWERWVREHERAALDKVAMAWGLREKWRWGEEEGQEWEALKDWIGLRGMILDKVSLMEGME